MKIGILDYGVGNLFSLKCALERMGASSCITRSLSEAEGCDGLILPGVGSFSSVAAKLRRSKQLLVSMASGGMPILGVCLGMQLFFEESEEGTGEGLRLMRGRVVKLPSSVKVPHMGWNTLHIKRDSRILDGVKEGSWVYFVHSYYPVPSDERISVAETSYGITLTVIVEDGNLIGTQFHPEKSFDTGLSILRNFLSYVKR